MAAAKGQGLFTISGTLRHYKSSGEECKIPVGIGRGRERGEDLA